MMPIIQSLLDSDLYKFTMQQAVLQKFPNAYVKYEFINRGGTKFHIEMFDSFVDEIYWMKDLRLTKDEQKWLKKTCPFFTDAYLNFLKNYKFDPDKVTVLLENEDKDGWGELIIKIEGYWYDAILWEVPLMALLSEIYFKFKGVVSSEETVQDAHDKMFDLRYRHECRIADFGTRRRLSFEHQYNIVKPMNIAFVGTSNVHIAHLTKHKPIGTQAHEWFMFHGAVYGYKQANAKALENWVDVYNGNLGIALTDTFTTDNFLKAFDLKYSKLFDGVRHDSGDPFEFIDKILVHYYNLEIPYRYKTIVFSDSLYPELIIRLKEKCESLGVNCSFGYGTNLTNDIAGSTPLNIVIKMTYCILNHDTCESVIKLSDSIGKHTGCKNKIELCKKTLGIK